jgi:hypothetical protein
LVNQWPREFSPSRFSSAFGDIRKIALTAYLKAIQAFDLYQIKIVLEAPGKNTPDPPKRCVNSQQSLGLTAIPILL